MASRLQQSSKMDSAFQINLEMYLKRTTSNYAAVNLGTLMGLVKMKVCLKTSAPTFFWATANKSDKLKNLAVVIVKWLYLRPKVFCST